MFIYLQEMWACLKIILSFPFSHAFYLSDAIQIGVELCNNFQIPFSLKLISMTENIIFTINI